MSSTTILFIIQPHRSCMHRRMVRVTQVNSCCVKLNLSFLELWSQQARAELSWLKDLGRLQQREYELQVNKTEEIEQRLVELWRSSNTKLSENLRFSCLCVSTGSAEALVRWGGKIKYHLTAYSRSNISAKKLSKSLMYIEVVASQSSAVILRHSVYVFILL